MIRKILTAIWHILRVLLHRALPMAVFAVMFIILAVTIDKWRVESTPADNFVNFYAFTVNNTRVGEDVYFKVCRTHDQNYRVSGNLEVYVYRDADVDKQGTLVYSQDINGFQVSGNCENKVLKAKDYSHQPGTYKMRYCIEFTVKYDVKKSTCTKSNIYKVFEQPADILAQIEYYQNIISQLEDRLNMIHSVAESGDPTSTNSGTTVPGETGATGATGPPGTSASPPAPKTHEVCTVNALGIKLGCRQEPL